MKGIAIFLLAACMASGYAQVDECPAEQESDWTIEMLLRHEDCNKFYKCTFGVPIEYSCYGDLYFNLDTWQCDWQYNVDCEGRNIPEETTTSTSTTEAPTTTTSEATTTTTEATTTTTEATTTTTEATTTTTEEPTTTTTTTTTTSTTTTEAPTTTTTTTTTEAPTTSTTTTTTEAPTTTNSTTTTEAPTTTNATTTTESPTTTNSTSTTEAPTNTTSQGTTEGEGEDQEIEFQENGCPVDPHIHWLLPHETECNQFYYCVWGEKVLRDCPETLHFNPVLQVCDWPRDAGCTTGFNKHLLNMWTMLRNKMF